MKNLLWLFVFLLLASPAYAIKIKATWELNDPAEQVENYILYERTVEGKVELGRVSGSVNSFTGEHTGDCKTYMLTAKRGTEESLPAVANFCPEPELPPIYVRPGTPIILNIIVEKE